MAKDALGAEVEVGDLAIYVTSGRYTTRGVVRVIGVQTRARVRWVLADRQLYASDKEAGILVSTSSLFIVEKFKGNLPAED